MMRKTISKTITISLALFTGIFAVGVASADLNNGLVGHWKFDDSSNIGLDSSSYGNNGTPATGYVNFYADGIIGGAAKFTAGSNAGITVQNAASLNFNQGMTAAAWVLMDVNDGNGTIISKSDSSSNEPGEDKGSGLEKGKIC